ncbi:septal ring lytic transglycosylase RlpA family protein [Sneathiella sp.]|uniref:septal ring lytic transglycosylase RlpA family protein n=1 Tax=Sneathiella sp. TaxID=1964365 RepID=UPI0026226BB4|nr:septal ring lytic transglycosylase RlpA family protein [Sneathiella sp.]MDF2369043.1 septal ring lytic transglycosylase RlpA family protein [Sneathiella sp.]
MKQLIPNTGILAILATTLLIGGCSEVNLLSYGAKKYHASHEKSNSAVGNNGIDRGESKIGKPYEVAGIWYYPKVDNAYDETGIASWYGEPFHGRKTANGAVYDMHQLTAAHKTLPLPTDVRVTNLENGRSIIVTVNDRGPFAHSRIIDMSYRGAQLLGMVEKGTAKVRVQVINGGDNLDQSIIAKPETPVSEKNNVAAAPQAKIVSGTLAPPPNIKAAPLPKVEQLPAPTGTPAKTQLASSTPYSTPSPVVSAAPITESEIFIQAGAFVDYNNANVLSARLSTMGPTKVSQVLVNGQDFYRVRLGPVQDIARADQVLENLINTGHTDARIIIE